MKCKVVTYVEAQPHMKIPHRTPTIFSFPLIFDLFDSHKLIFFRFSIFICILKILPSALWPNALWIVASSHRAHKDHFIWLNCVYLSYWVKVANIRIQF